MLSWQKIRTCVRGKPPIPTGVIIAVIPLLALTSAWLQPLTGIGSLSTWLKIAYFASLSYFVSCVLFAVYCPDIVKQYDCAVDRIERERNSYANSNPAYRFEIVITQLGQNEVARIELLRLAAERDSAIGSNRAELDTQINELVDREWVNAVQQYLARGYDEADLSRPRARASCTLALVVFALGVVAVLFHRTILVVSG